MKNAKQYKLVLGQQTDLVISIFRGIAVCYTGQLHDYVYSIAVIQTKGNNSYAYNIYFNADQKAFNILNGMIKIIHVDAQYIEFTFSK